MTSIYVTSLTGYCKDGYDGRAELMEKAGFVCLREVMFMGYKKKSRRPAHLAKDPETGKYWEVWYLPFVGHGDHPKNPLKDATTTDEVVKWLMHEIGPGNIGVVETTWGAGLG